MRWASPATTCSGVLAFAGMPAITPRVTRQRPTRVHRLHLTVGDQTRRVRIAPRAGLPNQLTVAAVVQPHARAVRRRPLLHPAVIAVIRHRRHRRRHALTGPLCHRRLVRPRVDVVADHRADRSRCNDDSSPLTLIPVGHAVYAHVMTRCVRDDLEPLGRLPSRRSSRQENTSSPWTRPAGDAAESRGISFTPVQSVSVTQTMQQLPDWPQPFDLARPDKRCSTIRQGNDHAPQLSIDRTAARAGCRHRPGLLESACATSSARYAVARAAAPCGVVRCASGRQPVSASRTERCRVAIERGGCAHHGRRDDATPPALTRADRAAAAGAARARAAR